MFKVFCNDWLTWLVQQEDEESNCDMQTNSSHQSEDTSTPPNESSWLELEPPRGYSTRRGFRSPYRNGMSEKLRKRLGKRGRVFEIVDNIVNTAYYNVTTDLMGKDVSDEWWVS